MLKHATLVRIDFRNADAILITAQTTSCSPGMEFKMWAIFDTVRE